MYACAEFAQSTFHELFNAFNFEYDNKVIESIVRNVIIDISYILRTKVMFVEIAKV